MVNFLIKNKIKFNKIFFKLSQNSCIFRHFPSQTPCNHFNFDLRIKSWNFLFWILKKGDFIQIHCVTQLFLGWNPDIPFFLNQDIIRNPVCATLHIRTGDSPNITVKKLWSYVRNFLLNSKLPSTLSWELYGDSGSFF